MLVKKVTRIEIKQYRTKDLAALYKMSGKTFNRNIKGIKEKLGERIGQYWNITQVETIVAHMVLPYTMEIDDEVNI
jgi:hypothetical protein